MSIPKEGSRDIGDGIIVCLTPDVCKTPMGSSTPPIPYSVFAKQGDDANTTATVRMTKKRAHNIGSLVTKTQGDGPGSAGGIKSGTVGAAAHPKGHSGNVNIEGKPAIRHTDEWYMNNKNTVGKLTYVKATETFEHTPAIRLTQEQDSELDGSAFAEIVEANSGHSDAVAAILQGMERARSEGLPPGSFQVAQAQPQVVPDTQPRPTVPGSQPSTSPGGAPGTPANDNRPPNRVTRSPSSAAAASRILSALGLGALGWEIGDQAGQWYVGPDGVMGRALGNHLRNQTWGDLDRMNEVADLPWYFGADANINNANDLLAMKTGRNLDFRTLPPEELEEIIEAPWPEPAQMRENWESVQRQRADEEDENTRAESETTPDNVRITGEEEEDDTQCRTETICFMPQSPDVDMDEFRRQMKLQEAGLNRMTPGEMLTNRSAYLADPDGMRALSDPLQQRTRAEYRASRQDEFEARFGPDAEDRLDEHMSGLAALHNPDMIAGGLFSSVSDPALPLGDRMGGLNENSSMGSQWRGARSERLTEHAERQQANGCPSVQVILEVCPSEPGSPGTPVG